MVDRPDDHHSRCPGVAESVVVLVPYAQEAGQHVKPWLGKSGQARFATRTLSSHVVSIVRRS
jgi:hypothetical protein